jgi:FAD:protein FMN transferase
MQETRILMGMPVTVCIVDGKASQSEIDKIFEYFTYIDNKFSTYKDTSEISAINRGELKEEDWSEDMKIVFSLSEETKKETNGYFEIKTPAGPYDPSGLVKGWAIWNAAKILKKDGFENFYVDAGGDVQPRGKNAAGGKWSVGIRNPFKANEIVKTVYVNNEGVATSGTYVRGEHIYNPKSGLPANAVVSLTVIGPNIYEADRFATAAFAMGMDGIRFIENLPDIEGYMIDKKGMATMTTGFEKYTGSV